MSSMRSVELVSRDELREAALVVVHTESDASIAILNAMNDDIQSAIKKVGGSAQVIMTSAFKGVEVRK